jgi:hypothetical protein
LRSPLLADYVTSVPYPFRSQMAKVYSLLKFTFASAIEGHRPLT